MSEISPMVTMLAERMRTNPEDFVWHSEGDSTKPKFYEIAQILSDMVADPKVKYYWFLNDTEKQILMDAHRDLCRKNFEDMCMKQLLEDKQEHIGPASVKYKAQGRYQTGWNDPRMAMQREDLRVGVGENGVNQITSI